MDYTDEILAAITHIEENIRQDVSLNQLSTRIGLSCYHFHRICSAVLGESLAEYIRKRRLSEAAQDLISTDKPIIEIALESHFDSQEAFSRAFKKMFGTSPGKYRSRGIRQIPHKQRTNFEMMKHLKDGITMEPKIVTRPQEYAIGLGNGFPYDSLWTIHDLWDEFLKRKHEIKNIIPSHALGICMIEHPKIQKNNDQTFVYMAAVPVSSIADIPEGMVSYEIPAARYAVFTHKGPLSELPHTMNYIWGTWVPKCEFIRKDAPDLELYDARFDCDSDNSEFDICVPIV